jgi:hypothetical protein
VSNSLPDLPPLQRRPRKPAKPKTDKRSPKPRAALPDIPPVATEHQAWTPPAAIEDLFRVETRAERMSREVLSTINELASREREGLSLYRPLPWQDEFHSSQVKTRVLRGSTRAGKTLPAAVELARAVRNCDPYGKYPTSGTVYIVGFDYSHHGETIYPKLFEPGAFKVIRDRKTNLWRAYQPWWPEDAERADEAKDAGPLIPDRIVAEVSWEDKKERIPSVMRLTTGWVLRFFSGDGTPPRGQAIDIGWMDEEIRREQWYSELVSRCVDRNGKIIWTAAPQTGTQQLYELSEQAEFQRFDPERVVHEIHAKLANNPHISDRAKADMSASLTEAERVVRIDGDFLINSAKMYPEFNVKIHGTPWFEIPGNWTRYMIVDPGHQICAVLFAAVPPPDDDARNLGDAFLYDELYIPRCSAAIFAEKVRAKAMDYLFEEFIIDTRGSRVHEAGSGQTIADQYAAALAAVNIRCRVRGSSFCWGSDNLAAGIESVRGLLRVGKNGRPGVRVMTHQLPNAAPECGLPNFGWEIGRYRKKRKGDLVLDVPDESGRVHLMACFRYFAAYGAKYVRPPVGADRPDSPAYLAMQQKRRSGRRVGTVMGVGRSES